MKFVNDDGAIKGFIVVDVDLNETLGFFAVALLFRIFGAYVYLGRKAEGMLLTNHYKSTDRKAFFQAAP